MEPRPDARPVDTLGRGLRDLRISVTDRCNMRCRYCMPREIFGPGFAFAPRSELLTFEEITLVATAFARAGVRKLRLTGGEPLLRASLPDLVAMLAAVPGIDDLALTTNGSTLARHAASLRAAGLSRVTVSLDTLDPELFHRISDSAVTLDAVLDGIAAAADAGFAPIKLNTVVRKGWNDGDIEALAGFGRERGHVVRFIEYMDVGDSNGWKLDEVVPSAEVVRRIGSRWPVEPADPNYVGEVASRYRYLDGAGEIGVISSITQPFCGSCTRARLSAVGEVFTCLFASRGHDLRSIVRSGMDAEELAPALDDAISKLWTARGDRYSELRAAATESSTTRRHKIEMSYIGG